MNTIILQKQQQRTEAQNSMDKEVLFMLSLHTDAENPLFPYELKSKIKGIYASYGLLRQSVTRLRDSGVPILNRGKSNGPWYIPGPQDLRFVEEDIAHRRRTPKSWDTRTDIMEASAKTRLSVLNTA